MTRVNIALDIFCLVILSLILLSLILEHNKDKKLSNVMFKLIPVTMFYICTNLISQQIKGHSELDFLCTILMVLSFITGYMVIALYLQFIVINSNNKKLIEVMPKVQIAMVAISSIPALITPWTGWYFTIENSTFIPGPYYALSFIFVGIVYIQIILISFTQKSISRTERIIVTINVGMHFTSLIGTYLYSEHKVQYWTATLIVFMIYMMIYNKKSDSLYKATSDLNQSETNLMLSKIQPHFLFNALTSISALCKTNPELAQKSIENFAKYLRTNMDNLGNDRIVDFKTELQHTQIYLDLEKLRYEDRLTILYDISCNDFNIPSLTLQPIVENAIKHGIAKKDEGGTVTISTVQINDNFVIVVQDDGVGFDVTKKPASQKNQLLSGNKSKRSHVGMENVKQRLETMCKGRMEIASKPGEGTRVTLYIPANEKSSSSK